MTKRTPQEKKALSYERDRRNPYHENDKASRRIIPLRKAKVNRAYRKKVNEILQDIPAAGDVQEIDLIESRAASVKKGDWMKMPDMPLGEIVERQLERRESHAGSGKTARKRVREFVANLKIDVKQGTDGRWIANAEGIPAGIIVERETREDAIERCKQIAGAYYFEKIGAGEVLSVDENSIWTGTY